MTNERTCHGYSGWLYASFRTSTIAHQFTVLFHSQGRQFLLVHKRRVSLLRSQPNRTDGITSTRLQGSAYSHCTRSLLDSLAFLNTRQFQQAAITS